ncbi:MAG TPA: hemerythrin domain-containing protein [Phycisphaerae bacterium]|nr:hemerythrin domain-containing protein [Phycisphaerae bacterium]HOM52792.1 hemerythrin domain-containing protein [Phycisphaerae bacterium]HOQ86788.1 hemerythrin domain-containing protein [Phycisphaerae bacterium]HPZ98944.1 hemerythrin domain-containing protein [Phycisphaerae bacterium]HQE26119.1 hemerythrin domain-containing protein [Phycisphaerae bacterium]
MPIQIGGRPDAGFDEPLRLLSDCHRRIERFLGILAHVTRTLQGGELDPESRRALESALRYFRVAAPNHTADEEESLFPRLRSTSAGQDPALMAVVSRLEHDHQAVRGGHDVVERLGRQWLERNHLAADETRELLEHIEALEQAYAEHIHLEDAEVFPAAGRLLDSRELADVGREMASRRGLNIEDTLSL